MHNHPCHVQSEVDTREADLAAGRVKLEELREALAVAKAKLDANVLEVGSIFNV